MRAISTRFLFIALIAALGFAGALFAAGAARAESAYDFDFRAIDGEPLPMSRFRGHPVLLVNTASFCGYTHQYGGLQELYDAYRGRGLVVLGVPSNDFGNQEPGTEKEIKRFCEVNFAVDFPLTEKQSVRGPGAHPLYRWIARELGPGRQPGWNFHKYLIDGEGRVVGAWPSRVAPMSAEIREAVEAMLPAG